MGNRYSPSERAEIAAGTFFTVGELAARPWIGHLQAQVQHASEGQPGDPNNRPISAEVRALAEGPGVCAYCYEPGDERSALIETARHDFMHSECDEAWEAEQVSRRTS
jgi:hypothetical protein